MSNCITLDSLFSISNYPSLLHGSLEYFILIGQSVNAAMLYNCSLIICASIISTEYFNSNQYFMFMYLFEKELLK